MKAKIFISDLHIGGGSAADDFNLKKEIFCSLIKKLTDTYAPGSELILLGDIFDLIEQQTNLDIRTYKENLLEALHRSLQQHREAVEALRIWLHSGNKIFYITGNHDHAMRWPNFSKPLIDELLIAPKGCAADQNARERIVIDDWYASETFGIYAEHGNRFDDENNHGGEPIPLGSDQAKRL
ncbi:MAG: metallophosphoesterase [Desulfobacteraceae bacterium]|nr:metallophosphoesterase [Desulfobacteraceae bacterium]